MNLDRMQTLWDKAHNAARRRNLIPGTLGKLTPGGSTVVLATERGPGYVHVRLGSDGALGTAYAYNIAVPPLKGYPVLLLREDNLLVVAGPDYARLPAFLAGEGGQGGGYTVPPHHHREGSGLEYEQQSKLIDVGRVLWSSGLTVTIRPFHYRLSDGSHAYYAGGTLDLTAYVPGTAGQHAWVVVGVDPSDNTAKAATGTAISTGTALNRADIGGVLDDSYIPLAAIDVANGDTQLNQPGDYVDAREWINTAGGGSGASDFLTLGDTPSAYTGQAGKRPAVNAAENALEFTNVGWSELTGVPSSFTPSAHAANHKHGGSDEVATATPAANAIPKAGSGGTLAAGWIPLSSLSHNSLANLTTGDAHTQYLLSSGNRALTGDWDIGSGRKISAGALWARDANGIGLYDDAGNPGVFVADGGNVGIGHSSPSYPFHLQVAADIADGILARYRGHRTGANLAAQYYHDGTVSTSNKMSLALILNTSTQDRTAANIAASFANTTDASRTSLVEFNTAANGSFGPAMTLLGNLLGLNTVTSPQGTLHAHDGTGGMMFVTKTNINGTAQTIIPNGAGDITLAVVGFHVTAAGTTPTGGILGPIGLGATQNVVVGGNTYQYALSAAGALTVQRTAGATAGSCALLLLWL